MHRYILYFFWIRLQIHGLLFYQASFHFCFHWFLVSLSRTPSFLDSFRRFSVGLHLFSSTSVSAFTFFRQVSIASRQAFILAYILSWWPFSWGVKCSILAIRRPIISSVIYSIFAVWRCNNLDPTEFPNRPYLTRHV
jgi:hypothetical protein